MVCQVERHVNRAGGGPREDVDPLLEQWRV
jgi:hypothetical protein